MPTVKCLVKVETEAWKCWVSINDQDLKFEKGTALITLPVGESLYMAWYFVGDHGTSYKITLEPPHGYRVASVGKHPIERTIALSFGDSSDTQRLFILGA